LLHWWPTPWSAVDDAAWRTRTQSYMELEHITAILKKLRRDVAKGSTPSVRRERELYSALLGLVDFVEELDAGLVLAGAMDIGSRLTRLEERLQERGSVSASRETPRG
jgi:hypothetical protein